MKRAIHQDYKEWVISLLGRPKIPMMFVDILYNVEFRWIIPEDRRRAEDGLNLRREYPKIRFLSEDDQNRPCSVLEMLAAFAIRIDREWVGNPGENRSYIVFDDMIRNLSLTKANANYVLDRWLNRDFHPDGRGSIFPLIHPTADQRHVEIWRQMLAYINERYI